MPRRRDKPILHARDHEPGGPDPIRVGLSTFGLTGGPFTLDGSMTPLILDTPDNAAPMYFHTNAPDSFDVNNGRARILRAGLYMIGCQMGANTLATLTANRYIHLMLTYQGDIGYYLETPWIASGFAAGGSYVEQILGASHVYMSGTVAGIDVFLQRLHPISLLSSVTFPLEIQPKFDTNTIANTEIVCSWLGLWGVRLSGDLGPDLSNG